MRGYERIKHRFRKRRVWARLPSGAMLGMLYIVITAVLMLGAVFGHEGIAVIVVGVLVALFVLWAMTSRRPHSDGRDDNPL